MDKRVEIATTTSLLGVCVNTALAAVKITTGVVGNSYALIADGIESLGDIFASLVVWRGVVVAARPPDEDHPYGHGRAETLATGVVALMLIGAAMLIIYESVNEILSPHGSPAPFTLVVLAAVIAIKEGLYRFVDKAAASAESSAVQADAWHHRADALTSAAAFVGITVALIGGKGWEGADDVAAIFAGGVIAYNGAHILGPVISEIMETSPETMLEPIRRLVASLPEIEHVDKCRASQVGFRMFVDLHIHVDPQMTVSVSHALAHHVKDQIRQKFPQVADVTIHVEPCRKMVNAAEATAKAAGQIKSGETSATEAESAHLEMHAG